MKIKCQKIHEVMLWTAAYFGVMFIYTFLDIAVWRMLFPGISDWINTIVIILCVYGFVRLLKKTGYQARLFSNITFGGLFLALGCSLLFFLLLDLGLDPVLERMFPHSEQTYQEMMERLLQSPVTGFLQVCMIAPVIEEVLLRDYVLGGLRDTCGVPLALVISSTLFALLHFNMVQSLSAAVCGILLGILYLRTDSVFCCIVAHSGYNVISYLVMMERFGKGIF